MWGRKTGMFALLPRLRLPASDGAVRQSGILACELSILSPRCKKNVKLHPGTAQNTRGRGESKLGLRKDAASGCRKSHLWALNATFAAGGLPYSKLNASLSTDCRG